MKHSKMWSISKTSLCPQTVTHIQIYSYWKYELCEKCERKKCPIPSPTLLSENKTRELPRRVKVFRDARILLKMHLNAQASTDTHIHDKNITSTAYAGGNNYIIIIILSLVHFICKLFHLSKLTWTCSLFYTRNYVIYLNIDVYIFFSILLWIFSFVQTFLW